MGLSSEVVLAAANQYTYETVMGAGAIKGEDGYSPAVTITSITGGHKVNITDKDHTSGQNFDVMDGVNGADGIGVLNYSTSEQDTGLTWVDGKKLYQKSYNLGALPNSTTKTVQLFEDRTKQQIVDVNAISIRSADNALQTLPYLGSDASFSGAMGFYITESTPGGGDTAIVIWTSSDRTNCNGYVTIKYTKATT